ncbi:hypothetical protein EC973_000817 [Apophysomyces ossiformis]|uniref:RNA helicase n=1 Tax=Apophysomyces ossiformis TaxID=679940 RepID=A0A8H7ENM4_9FUNG|nr:hypothetical protein EC973_000817 [Apophysomyces ossiformis]
MFTSRTFQHLGIPTKTAERLRSEFGIEQPTQAQTQFIPAVRSGRDLLLRDRTGTGKTFGLALALTSLRRRSLYLAPNEELVTQVRHWVDRLEGIGSSTSKELLVSTPADAMKIDRAILRDVHRIVLDEADQALRLPKRYATARQQRLRQEHPKPAQILIDQLIMERKKKPQIIVASATLNRPLRYWLQQQGWTDNPLFIDLAKQQQQPVETADTDEWDKRNKVHHYCLVVSDDEIRNIMSSSSSLSEEEEGIEKERPLAEDERNNGKRGSASVDFDDLDDRMLDSVATLTQIESASQSILFVHPSVSTAYVQTYLAKHDIQSRDLREYVVGQPLSSTERPTLWLATEFSARGMDLPDVSHVYILGRPTSVPSYLHMAGRTGRLGYRSPHQSKVISLVRDQGWTTKKMLTMYQFMNISVEHYEHVQ